MSTTLQFLDNVATCLKAYVENGNTAAGYLPTKITTEDKVYIDVLPGPSHSEEGRSFPATLLADSTTRILVRKRLAKDATLADMDKPMDVVNQIEDFALGVEWSGSRCMSVDVIPPDEKDLAKGLFSAVVVVNLRTNGK
jgi:hypothetical protein